MPKALSKNPSAASITSRASDDCTSKIGTVHGLTLLSAAISNVSTNGNGSKLKRRLSLIPARLRARRKGKDKEEPQAHAGGARMKRTESSVSRQSVIDRSVVSRSPSPQPRGHRGSGGGRNRANSDEHQPRARSKTEGQSTMNRPPRHPSDAAPRRIRKGTSPVFGAPLSSSYESTEA